jgi:hypothetical protein
MRVIRVRVPIKSKFRAAIMNIVAFKETSTQDLIGMIRSQPGCAKMHVQDRVEAIVLLLGMCPSDLN